MKKLLLCKIAVSGFAGCRLMDWDVRNHYGLSEMNLKINRLAVCGFLNNLSLFIRYKMTQVKVLHRQKSFLIFLSPAGMSLTKLSVGGNNLYMSSLFSPRESLVSDIPAGDGNIEKLFLRCGHQA